MIQIPWGQKNNTHFYRKKSDDLKIHFLFSYLSPARLIYTSELGLKLAPFAHRRFIQGGNKEATFFEIFARRTSNARTEATVIGGLVTSAVSVACDGCLDTRVIA